MPQEVLINNVNDASVYEYRMFLNRFVLSILQQIPWKQILPTLASQCHVATRSVPAHMAKSRVVDFFKESDDILHSHSEKPLGSNIMQGTENGEQID